MPPFTTPPLLGGSPPPPFEKGEWANRKKRLCGLPSQGHARPFPDSSSGKGALRLKRSRFVYICFFFCKSSKENKKCKPLHNNNLKDGACKCRKK